jgi:hypothetical protein
MLAVYALTRQPSAALLLLTHASKEDNSAVADVCSRRGALFFLPVLVLCGGSAGKFGDWRAEGTSGCFLCYLLCIITVTFASS